MKMANITNASKRKQIRGKEGEFKIDKRKERKSKLTANSPFCSPNGIGVSLVNITTLKPRLLSTTRMMAFKCSLWSFDCVAGERIRNEIIADE